MSQNRKQHIDAICNKSYLHREGRYFYSFEHSLIYMHVNVVQVHPEHFVHCNVV